MKIQMLRDWRRFKAGDEWSPDDGVANVLIRRKIAEPVEERKASPGPLSGKLKRSK